MTKYEAWSLVVQIAGTIVAIIVVLVAVMGELLV